MSGAAQMQQEAIFFTKFFFLFFFNNHSFSKTSHLYMYIFISPPQEIITPNNWRHQSIKDSSLTLRRFRRLPFLSVHEKFIWPFSRSDTLRDWATWWCRSFSCPLWATWVRSTGRGLWESASAPGCLHACGWSTPLRLKPSDTCEQTVRLSVRTRLLQKLWPAEIWQHLHFN